MFSYRWIHRFSMPPLEAVLDAVEAYFTTLCPGRYQVVRRERFCLEFRRGAWKRRLLDSSAIVPRFLGIDRRDITTWPTLLSVTTLPAPTTFEVTLQRHVQMPGGLALQPAHYEAGTAAFDRESDGLVGYLAEFLKLPSRPVVRAERTAPGASPVTEGQSAAGESSHASHEGPEAVRKGEADVADV